MQAKTIRKKIWPKLLTALLAVTLVFAMTPLGGAYTYAQDNDVSINIGGNVMLQETSLSAADVDGLLEETSFFGVNNKDNGSTHSVDGVFFTDLIDFAGLRTGADVEEVKITTYTAKNGEEVFTFNDTVTAADVEAKLYPISWLMDASQDASNDGKMAMIAYEWYDGENVSNVPRLYIGGFDTMPESANFPGDFKNRPYWYEGITSIEVTGTYPVVNVGGNIMQQAASLAADDVIDISESADFFGANNKDNAATHSVTGVFVTDLIDYVGLKGGAAIEGIKITTYTAKNGEEVFSFLNTEEAADVDAKLYPLKWLTDASEDVENEGLTAMIAFEWNDGESVSYSPRLYIGGFDTMPESANFPGNYKNRPYWYEGITSIEVIGTVPTVSVSGNVMQKSASFTADDVTSLLKDAEYFGANNKDNGATHSVTGVLFEDLINTVGLKAGATIEGIKITTYTAKNGEEVFSFLNTEETADVDAKLYPLKWLTDAAEDEANAGAKAMVAFKWNDGENVNYTPRLYIGGFNTMPESANFPGNYKNRPYWYEGITAIEVIGKAPEVINGQKATVSGSTYTVTSASAGTVAFTKANNAKTVTIPATVKINGKTLKVNKIAAKAFKGTKAKTIIVKTKALTKKSVKGSLKGSKVKTVKVKVGSKKDNKKYVKKYKKIFTKKNAGKKVKVKR